MRLQKFNTIEDSSILAQLPEIARGHVTVADLAQQNIFDYGVNPTGSETSAISGFQLTYGDEAMILARWPNEGFLHEAGPPKSPVLTYSKDNEDHILRWKNEEDPRGMGYWTFDWSSCAIAFSKIDSANRQITPQLGGNHYGFRNGGRWFGYNLLCELDSPGEYYVDRLRGRLYFWPPKTPSNGVTEVSVDVNILILNDVSNVLFQGITFENCRGCAVQITNWQTWDKPVDFELSKWSNGQLLSMLTEIPANNLLWKSRYPELAMPQGAIANKTPRPIETRTRILYNIIWGGPSEWLEHHIPRGDNAWVVGKNLAGTDPLFVAPDKDNYHLRDGSPASAMNFNPLPIEKMGLYESPERAIWPVKSSVRIICHNLTNVKP